MTMTHTTRKRIGASLRFLVLPIILLVITLWLLNTPAGFLGKADAIGYAVCHRIPERSFHIGERALPLCARCSGMYLGAMVGLAVQALMASRRQNFPRWSIAAVLIAFVLAFVVDGANSYLYLVKSVVPGFLGGIENLYIPNNTLRILTGSGMGIGLAALLFPAFNQTMWIEPVDKPSLEWRSFLIVLAITLVVDLLVLTESPVVLYPAAVISSAGVLILLSMVYAVVWTILTRQDGSFTNLKGLWFTLLVGVTIALLQVLAIDLLRLKFTGTWGAIPFS
jgi:uncharacterized membrane protein